MNMKKYWWFGINNLAQGKTVLKSRPHVTYAEIAPVLSGQQKEFAWPYGGSPYSLKYYPQMQAGDKIIFWMGDGAYQQDWGIIGFGVIDRIKNHKNIRFNQYILHMTYVPSIPITPYRSHHPQETENTAFLKNIFEIEFRPLSKVFKQLRYRDTISIVTIEELRKDQYEAVLNRAEKFPNVIIYEATEEEKNGYTLANNEEIGLLEHINTVLNNPELDKTIKERLQFSRIGQERFRKALIVYWKGRCAITGVQDIRILRASHIKPWRVCNNFERLDVFNGLLLIPNLDAVLDQGLITFDEQGKIIIPPCFQEQANILGINKNMRISLDERHQKYLDYHRDLYKRRTE